MGCGGKKVWSWWFGASVGGVLVRKPPEVAAKRLTREISRRLSFAASVAFGTALPRFLLAAVFLIEKQAGRPCLFFRWIREPRCDRHLNGFLGLSMVEFGRTSLGQLLIDSGDG